jgi:CheY-like chemotaxis protein
VSRRSVLVVDDDPDFRRLATLVLTGWGHVVLAEAGGVADALATSLSSPQRDASR